jgi:hypothetical protein
MTYPLLIFASLLTPLFVLCIGLIRAQPHNDGELHAFLTPPDDCPMPCFMGIRPGVTTYEEAVAILEAHEWIRAVDHSRPTSFIITWNDTQPPWLPRSLELRLVVADNILQRVFAPTKLRLGDIWLALGPPERLFRLESLDNLGSFNAIYPFGKIAFTIAGSCSMRSVWEARIFLDFDVEQNPGTGLQGSDMLRDVVERCWKLRAIIGG